MSRPKVSVIMPAYNHAAFVGSAMNSVFSQTLKRVELIVGDDSSADDTKNVIHERAGKAPISVRVLDKGVHRGASAVMNDLLDACEGEYVAVINSDDEFIPNKLERQLAFMESRPRLTASFTWAQTIDEAGGVVSNARYPGSLFDQKNRSRTGWLRKLFFEGNCLCHPTLMARRDRFQYRLDVRLCKLPDYELWTRLLADGGEIAVLPERLTRFRVLRDCGSASGKSPETLTLINHELPFVLDNYARLDALDCLSVFGETGSPHYCRFAAYRAALTLCPAAQAWGIRGIYGLLGEPEGRRELKKAGFGDTALFPLAAQYDVYSELPDRMKLYFANSADLQKNKELLAAFSEERTSACAVTPGHFIAHFPIGEAVAAVRFDPAERPCRVRLSRAYLELASGKALEITPVLRHNGREGLYTVSFDTTDPWFVCLLACEVWALQAVFEGEWE